MSAELPYMADPAFGLLRTACEQDTRSAVARKLGVSPPVVTQVLNGTGAYGTGAASPRKLFLRVEAAFGHWPCPHLTEQGASGEPHVISAAQCRTYAHRPAPTGSPRDIAHWQACRQCAHHAATAPPVPRPKVPRKRHQDVTPITTTAAAAPAASPTQEGNAP